MQTALLPFIPTTPAQIGAQPAFTSQSKNTVYAGPASGSNATPAFRALTAADIPIATASALGIIQPDNSTVVINGSGILSATLGGGVYSVLSYGALGTAQRLLSPCGGTMANASHTLTVTLPIVSIVPTITPTSNYTSVPTVTITGSGGATAQAILSGGTTGYIININVTLTGAYGSAPTATVSAPSSGPTPTLTVTLQTGFLSGDVGKFILVQNANASAGFPLSTTIATYVSQFSVTLTAAAGRLATTQQVAWGADDSAAFNAAVNAASQNPAGGTVFIPAGQYWINQTIYWCSQVSMYGVGSHQSILIAGEGLITSASSVIQQQGGVYSAANPMVDCNFKFFEIDFSNTAASGVTGEKCIYMQYMDRGSFFDLYLHDSPGTCLGSDFMNRTWIMGCTIANGGRGGTSASLGNSGIGVGTNANAAQGVVIAGNYISGCTRYGIFFENQVATLAVSKGCRISNNVCTNNMVGIGDSGCYGIIIDSNICYGNVQRSATGGHGIAIDTGTLNHTSGIYPQITNNQCFSNGGDGIRVDMSNAAISTSTLADIYPTIANNKSYLNTGYGVNMVCNATSTVNTSAVVINNVLNNNTSGAFGSSGNFISTTGHPIWIKDNVGYNDQQTPGSISVGASPFTYTAGNTPENIYVTGGTISSITKNSIGLSASVTGDITIPLLPGQSIIVTYAVAPTMVADKN